MRRVQRVRDVSESSLRSCSLVSPIAASGQSRQQQWGSNSRRCDRPYFAVRSRSELRTTNTDEQAIAALASMGESSPAIASGTINTL